MKSVETYLDEIDRTNEMNKSWLSPDDYLDKHGFIICSKCHTRKQREIEWRGKMKKVTVHCQCQMAELNKVKQQEERQIFRRRIEELRKDGITDYSYLNYTFAKDDGTNQKLTKACKQYVQQFNKMIEKNVGIIFYGNVGVGKTFYACCIANAILDNCIPASVTNFSRLLNKLQGSEKDKQNIIDDLNNYDLLVIDDLGIERNTAYGLEQIFNIIDSRLRSEKPLIITTNLSVEEMKNTTDLNYKRIYDRVLEMCPIQLNMTGISKRLQVADERRKAARELLNG